MAKRSPVSDELAELLAAYGAPPKMPAYDGNPVAYAAAVNAFSRLSATPDAVARRTAMERYFERTQEASSHLLPGTETAF